MRKSMSVLLAAVMLSLAARSQSITPSVINATGNTYTGGIYSFEWSVGELAVIETMRSSNGLVILTNGFLQPDLANSNGVGPRNFTSEEIRISPNPTYNQVEVAILTKQQGLIQLQLYDARGKLLYSKKISSYGTGLVEPVNLTPYAAGTYFLRMELQPAPGSVPQKGSFKIVKM